MRDDQLPDDESRRKFMKSATATGIAAAGLTAFSGSAAGQQQNIRRLNVGGITLQDGVLNVTVRNVNVPDTVNIEDIVEDVVVTVIGGDVVVDIDEVNILRFEGEVNVIRNALNDLDLDVIVQDNVVQVAIVALSDTGEIIAQGCGATNDL